MLEEIDRHAQRRAELLEPVADLCRRAGLAAGISEFRSRFGPAVPAVRCVAGDGSWDAAITVVRARPLPPT